jgi:hypothetical protein
MHDCGAFKKLSEHEDRLKGKTDNRIGIETQQDDARDGACQDD